MSATASQFHPMLSSVIGSQDVEVTLGKQPIMAEYGREVRATINALPPEVSRSLLAGYQEPTPQLVTQMENAIMSRELAIENAEQEKDLDQAWLAGSGKGRTFDESGLGADDEWNTPSV